LKSLRSVLLYVMQCVTADVMNSGIELFEICCRPASLVRLHLVADIFVMFWFMFLYFKNRLDKFWSSYDFVYLFTAQLLETGSVK